MNSCAIVEKGNTCIVIVTYNPDVSFLESVYLYKKLVDRIIVVDNGSDQNSCIFLSLREDNHIELICSESNKGIAWALNMGIKRALVYAPNWIVTFDQDSRPLPEILDYYNQVIKAQPSSKIGLISGRYAKHPLPIVDPITWKHALTLITSGTLHNVELFDDVGWYNEKLFIDSVDFEFSLRVHKKGYSTILIQNEVLEHKLGDPKVRKMFFCKIESSNHNSLRRYFMARNHIYVSRMFFRDFPCWVLKKNYFFLISIVKILLVDDSKVEKIRQVWNGIIDGIKFK